MKDGQTIQSMEDIFKIDKDNLLVILITWAIENEWLIASSPDDKNNFSNYELCTEGNFEAHLEGEWIRLKKNGEAIQLRTK